MTLLAAFLGAVAVALVSASLAQARPKHAGSSLTLAQFDEASIPRTVH